MRKSKIFFGWYIVAAGFLCLWINAGIGFYSFPVFLVELGRTLGWDRFFTSIGISFTFIVAGLASPFVGRLLPLFGPKKLIVFGACLMSLSFIAFGFMTKLWQFYLICSVLAVSLACTGTMPTSYVISDWFQRKRGRATGVMMIGVGLGGLMFAPLTNWLIELLQLRKTFIVYAALISLVIIPSAVIIIRKRLVGLGVLPDGDLDEMENTNDARLLRATSPPSAFSWSFKSALRTRSFWIIGFAFVFATFGQTSILVHQVAFFQDIGIAPEKAAGALGLCALLGIGGKIFFGAMADWFPVRFAMMGCFGLQFLGTLLLLKTQALGSPFWFVLIWGFAMGGVIALEPLIVAECFGLESFGVILGMFYVLTTMGAALGPPFAGFIFETWRSYDAAFIAFAITYLLSTILCLFAAPPRLPSSLLD